VQVENMKHKKMLMRKDEQRVHLELREKQRQDDEFMQKMLEQKKQLLMQAIHSLGLDKQDLPKGTGLDQLK